MFLFASLLITVANEAAVMGAVYPFMLVGDILSMYNIVEVAMPASKAAHRVRAETAG